MNRLMLAAELDDISAMLKDENVTELWFLAESLRDIARQIEIATMASQVIDISDYLQ